MADRETLVGWSITNAISHLEVLSQESSYRAKGQFGSTNYEKLKVPIMEFSIVENLSGPRESIFILSRRP